MHLVDPKMLMQPPIRAPVNPIHRSIVTLDDDMRAVLDRRNLSDDEKVRQYNQIFQCYLEYHDHLKTPSPSKEANTVKEDEIIRTVPVKFRGRAEYLLKRIKREPNMHWNERGEFVHNGQVVKGSNIVDLVNDIMRHRKDFHPHGWQEFGRMLIPRLKRAVQKGDRGHVLCLKPLLDEEQRQKESNENFDHWALWSGSHSHK